VSTTLLLGGRVRAPGDRPSTAMLVDGERVAWLGTDDDAQSLRAAADEVVELEDALVTPAFVDAHVHSTSTGLTLDGLDLTGAASLAEVLDRVERYARRRRGVGILLGHGWDETAWPDHRPPTRGELDRATYGGAAYLTRIDVHSAVASSALIAAVPGLRDMAGYHDSGLLSRDAHHAARAAALDAVTPAQRAAAQRATRTRCAELGIGLLHELGGPKVSSPDDFAAMLALASAEPGPDVVGYWGELGGAQLARELGALGAAGDLFADGAIGSHTACLRTVYADQDSAGFGYLTAGQVRDHVAACTLVGVQAGFHVIGDGALDTVLAGFEEAAAELGADRVRAARHRLEHVEMPDAVHLEQMGRLNVCASVQPVFDALWGGDSGMYQERLGADRAGRMNPFAAMAAAGVPLAFGSDSPVTPLGPWEAVRAAAFHRTPSARLPVPVAFEAHTRGGWRAAGVDDAGVLSVGAKATYAVWDAEHGPDQLLPDLSPGTAAPSCLRTAVRGRTVWSADGTPDHLDHPDRLDRLDRPDHTEGSPA
jgi:predicted amidohydrolase YtcJ